MTLLRSLKKSRIFVGFILMFVKDVFGSEVKTVTEGHSFTLDTDVTEIQGKDRIVWTFKFGNCSAIVSSQSKDIYDSNCDETYRDRLQLDSRTGSLTIRNASTTDSGLYELQIYNNTVIRNKTFKISVIITAPDLHTSYNVLILCCAVLLFLAVGVIYWYFYWRKCRRADQEAGAYKLNCFSGNKLWTKIQANQYHPDCHLS
ncbi:uncharacterized protein LOC127438849 isoform X2 [Myxocyprinus asiaticus]|uniref:uncharacterized protein LOC127438849 isoform X1 n=1 Tax=Myxocyprinus asiaticus TaxID=70543 RepID=UPI002221824F|nr:uncharacterized protein LOC127438849 isoform X1 [Myxocyprinus asiaticus]XP_051550720.1 uncharacterized protein LOC127438849 isoform X2 [Myxocyprinus asiaticus]